MEANEVLLYVISKQFSKTVDEINELLYEDGNLKDDAGDTILQLNEDKIKKLKADREENFNRGYQKAQKEVLTSAEKKFKELTGFNKDADDFEGLVSSYMEESAKKTKKVEPSDDDVKKHPLFIQLEQSRVPKEEFDKVSNEFADFKKNQERNMVLSTIRSKAWDVVAGKNPILPGSQQIATTIRNKFLEEFGAFDFEANNGEIVVLKDGKRVEDQHGNLKPFNNVVMDIAGNFFEFQAQGDKGNAGNGAGGGSVSFNSMPKTGADLSKIFAEHGSESNEDKQIRIAAMKYYEANKVD